MKVVVDCDFFYSVVKIFKKKIFKKKWFFINRCILKVEYMVVYWSILCVMFGLL